MRVDLVCLLEAGCNHIDGFRTLSRTTQKGHGCFYSKFYFQLSGDTTENTKENPSDNHKRKTG